MTKVQLTLTDQEAAILTGYGDQFGYNLPKVAKFFISKAVESVVRRDIIPVYPMSDKIEKAGLQAIEDYKAGKTIEIKDIETYFENL